MHLSNVHRLPCISLLGWVSWVLKILTPTYKVHTLTPCPKVPALLFEVVLIVFIELSQACLHPKLKEPLLRFNELIPPRCRPQLQTWKMSYKRISECGPVYLWETCWGLAQLIGSVSWAFGAQLRMERRWRQGALSEIISTGVPLRQLSSFFFFLTGGTRGPTIDRRQVTEGSAMFVLDLF